MAYISFGNFGKKEQWGKEKEILEMEFTYDNWKKKSEILYNNYLMKCRKNCPQKIDFCLNYSIFVTDMLSCYECELTLNNFLRFIRNFFILEKRLYCYEKFIDMEEFNNLKKKVIEMYPKLKEKYGANRALEKIFYIISMNIMIIIMKL